MLFACFDGSFGFMPGEEPPQPLVGDRLLLRIWFKGIYKKSRGFSTGVVSGEPLPFSVLIIIVIPLP